MVNEKAEITGRRCAQNIFFGFGQNDKGLWVGGIDIGDYHYETDPYKDKFGAVSEVVGCLDALKEKAESVIDELRNGNESSNT